jgi:hypothetical protein
MTDQGFDFVFEQRQLGSMAFKLLVARIGVPRFEFPDVRTALGGSRVCPDSHPTTWIRLRTPARPATATFWTGRMEKGSILLSNRGRHPRGTSEQVKMSD